MDRCSQTKLYEMKSSTKVLNEWHIQKCHRSLVRDWPFKISDVGEGFLEEVILLFIFGVRAGQKGKRNFRPTKGINK